VKSREMIFKKGVGEGKKKERKYRNKELKRKRRAGGSSVAEHLPSICGVLGSISCTSKTNYL
jgi:hypothetical protein